jgi:hypothetical protein
MKFFIHFGFNFVAFALVCSCFSQNSFAGGDVGNPGDVVRCLANSENQLSGLYTLDFLALTPTGEQPLVSVKSYQESLFRIRQNLALKVPELAASFDLFTAEILNTDSSRHHIWEPAALELVAVAEPDLSLAVKIPSNCRKSDQIELIHAVVRQNPEFTGSGRIVFRYNAEILKSLETESPLQLSFLLVHEWLWSMSSNLDRNRHVNWFLHSNGLETMSRVEILKTLSSFGLDPLSLPVIVDSSGLGHFTNLEQALSAVRDGQTILLKEGTYTTGGQILSRPVTIIGEGDRDKIVIQGSYSNPALQIENSGVHIVHVTLTRKESEFSGTNHHNDTVLLIGSASPHVEDCLISSNQVYSLVQVYGESNPEITKSVIEARGGIFSLRLYDTASAILRENRFASENASIAIRATPHVPLVIQGNIFSEKTNCPISYDEDVKIDWSANQILSPTPNASCTPK